jgi:hypothetical protein
MELNFELGVVIFLFLSQVNIEVGFDYATLFLTWDAPWYRGAC